MSKAANTGGRYFKNCIKKISFPVKYSKFFFRYLIKYCSKNLFVYW